RPARPRSHGPGSVLHRRRLARAAGVPRAGSRRVRAGLSRLVRAGGRGGERGMSATGLAVQAREEFLSWLFDGRRASYGLALMRMAFGGMTLVTLALATPYYSYSYGAASRWGEAVIERSSINQYPWPLPFPFDRADSDPVLYVKVSTLA